METLKMDLEKRINSFKESLAEKELDFDKVRNNNIISNYNRASDTSVCLSMCVCKSTPRTADVTFTKITGYVRVRILMNR